MQCVEINSTGFFYILRCYAALEILSYLQDFNAEKRDVLRSKISRLYDNDIPRRNEMTLDIPTARYILTVFGAQ